MAVALLTDGEKGQPFKPVCPADFPVPLFLRGSFCAESRDLVAQLAGLLPELRQHRVGLVLPGAEPVERWRNFIGSGEQMEMERLEASAAGAALLRGQLRTVTSEN